MQKEINQAQNDEYDLISLVAQIFFLMERTVVLGGWGSKQEGDMGECDE